MLPSNNHNTVHPLDSSHTIPRKFRGGNMNHSLGNIRFSLGRIRNYQQKEAPKSIVQNRSSGRNEHLQPSSPYDTSDTFVMTDVHSHLNQENLMSVTDSCELSGDKNYESGTLHEVIENDDGCRKRDKRQLTYCSYTKSSYYPTPRLIIEFDTKMGQHRYSPTISHDSFRNHREHTLSIALNGHGSHPIDFTLLNQRNSNISNETIHSSNISSHHAALHPLLTIGVLLGQTFILLPPLVLSRRVLNSTWNALVDYFRGRYFRKTFTRLERAYLRYYEFPAVTRAISRTVSQIGVLFALSWLVRWWMTIVSMGNRIGSLVRETGYGYEKSGYVLVESSSRQMKLPCHVGKGLSWLCGVIWIGTVVGAGHAFAVALSVWGGPLRIQAAAQKPGKPNYMLSWIIHHPIQWIRGLDELQHLSSLMSMLQSGNKRSAESDLKRLKWRVFDPDPLLFPTTWMPLRWLQIFAIAKAFSTDPLQYRWCSPENQSVIIERLMKLYLVQLALGDEWSRVFLGEFRVGLGIVVVSCYFIGLAWMVFITFTLNGGAAAMLVPSLLASIISGLMNISIFWDSLGTREQRKALIAMGWK